MVASRDMEDAVEQIKYWLPRLHSIVIGPGLGRDEQILRNVKVSEFCFRLIGCLSACLPICLPIYLFCFRLAIISVFACFPTLIYDSEFL